MTTSMASSSLSPTTQLGSSRSIMVAMSRGLLAKPTRTNQMMFVGVAASRVKDLFARSRSYAPSIIFIDEIDAIGSKRGGPDIGGGGAEREQGLLQILTEMDGFKVTTSQVLVIGATNRLDILDPALLRKGRFDKIIRVGLPSKDGRLAILKVHARNKFFRSEAEKEELLQEVAENTEDFTGAELQNVL